MLKKNRIITVLLALVITMAVSATAQAVTTLISDYNKPITNGTPYVSATFTPKTDRINLRYGLYDSTSQYYSTYSLQALAGWSWYTMDYGNLNGNGNISRSFYVAASTKYRMRVTTTDPYSRSLFCVVEDAGN